MQLSLKFVALLVTLVGVSATPAESEPASYLVSEDEMLHWLANTDAELTYIGEPINPLSRHAAQVTTVTYCNRRIANFCGGGCMVYTGGAICLPAATTECLAATRNVGFCDRSGCRGNCNQLSTCGTWLDNGFCWTPGTASIAVGPS